MPAVALDPKAINKAIQLWFKQNDKSWEDFHRESRQQIYTPELTDHLRQSGLIGEADTFYFDAMTYEASSYSKETRVILGRVSQGNSDTLLFTRRDMYDDGGKVHSYCKYYTS